MSGGVERAERDLNGVHLPQFDSYDIPGLSAMILRNVLNNRIRYILDASG